MFSENTNYRADSPVLPGQSAFLYFDDLLHPEADGIFESLANLGFTSVIYIAKNYDGKTAFKSKYAEMAHNGLEIACKLGAKHNIRIYANLMVLVEGYSGSFGNGNISKFLSQHKDLATVERNGQSIYESPVYCDKGISYYCCPSSRLVQERFAAIACEVALHYPIEGIHLDCVRYPLPGDYCYCKRCRTAFRHQTNQKLVNANKEMLKRWRCSVMQNLITYTCSVFRDSVKDKTISALVWRAPECFNLGQDWANWPIDFVTPLYYQDYYYKTFRWLHRAVCADEKLGPVVVPALGGHSTVLSGRFFKHLCKIRPLFRSRSIMVGHYDTLHLLEVMTSEKRGAQISKDLLWLKRLCTQKYRRRFKFLSQKCGFNKAKE